MSVLATLKRLLHLETLKQLLRLETPPPAWCPTGACKSEEQAREDAETLADYQRRVEWIEHERAVLTQEPKR